MVRREISIMLASIGIILLCILMITSTYAYFVMDTEDIIKEPSTENYNHDISINYVDTSNVSMFNTYVGDKITKTFTVSNISESVIYYDILLEKVVNNFADRSDLVYSIVSNNTGAYVKQTILPNIDTTLASNIKIEPNEKHEYTMIINFLKKDTDQSMNMNKIFSSNINISLSKNINNGKNIYNEKSLGKIIEDNTISSENDINFNDMVVSDGIYYTNSTINGSTIYFYRGSKLLNNNVIYANYCWRIIRTTEDNGIRLIYNGEAVDGTCPGNRNNVLTDLSQYNTHSNYNAYVGYMYGNASSNNYLNEHLNINSSNIKNYLDDWYKKNINEYKSYITSNTIYCNNRKTSSFKLKGILYGTTGYGNNNSGYSIMDSYYNDKIISLSCDNVSDRFTVLNESGNKILNNPIGLITAEELYYAGYVNKRNNIDNYLYSQTPYWTMTPAYFNGSDAYNFIVNKGYLYQDKVINERGVRPVITVKSTVKVLSGDGSTNEPYLLYN